MLRKLLGLFKSTEKGYFTPKEPTRPIVIYKVEGRKKVKKYQKSRESFTVTELDSIPEPVDRFIPDESSHSTTDRMIRAIEYQGEGFKQYTYYLGGKDTLYYITEVNPITCMGLMIRYDKVVPTKLSTVTRGSFKELDFNEVSERYPVHLKNHKDYFINNQNN